MLHKLVMSLVVVTLHRGIFERTIHPFNLAIRPWMVWLGQPMLDAVFTADAVK